MHQIDWRQLAADFNPDTHSIIDGQAYTPKSDNLLTKYSPVDNRSLQPVLLCNQLDVDIAVSNARQAFNDKRWRGKSINERKSILFKFAELIDQHTQELALMDALEMGKSV